MFGGAVALSALTALYAGIDFKQALANNPEMIGYNQHLWTWFNVGGFAPAIGLYLDGLSLLMMGMITGVGLLIHIFASWYMRGEEGSDRVKEATRVSSLILTSLSQVCWHWYSVITLLYCS